MSLADETDDALKRSLDRIQREQKESAYGKRRNADMNKMLQEWRIKNGKCPYCGESLPFKNTLRE